MLIDSSILTLYSAATVLVHLLGIANAAHAVMNVRSSQGAIAWSISLITFPWFAIPFTGFWEKSISWLQGGDALSLFSTPGASSPSLW